jgi:hypothetical protein
MLVHSLYLMLSYYNVYWGNQINKARSLHNFIKEQPLNRAAWIDLAVINNKIIELVQIGT